MTTHDNQEQKMPTFSLNRNTASYEAFFKIQVDADIFNRVMITAVEEAASNGVDLTSPQAWETINARVSNPAYWLNRPHVKVTPVAPPVTTEVKQEVQPQPLAEIKTAPKVQSPQLVRKKDILEARLRESALHVPPHLWEKHCLTPTPPMSSPEKERKDVGRLRYDEKQFLKMLHAEYQRGEFVLDPNATEQERQYQESQQTALAATLESVADAVNGNRIH